MIQATKRKFNQHEIDTMIYNMVMGEPYEHPEDCQRIRNLVLEQRGVWVSVVAAGLFWSRHSCASRCTWLKLPENNDQILKLWDEFVANWYKDREPCIQCDHPDHDGIHTCQMFMQELQ